MSIILIIITQRYHLDVRYLLFFPTTNFFLTLHVSIVQWQVCFKEVWLNSIHKQKFFINTNFFRKLKCPFVRICPDLCPMSGFLSLLNVRICVHYHILLIISGRRPLLNASLVNAKTKMHQITVIKFQEIWVMQLLAKVLSFQQRIEDYSKEEKSWHCFLNATQNRISC